MAGRARRIVWTLSARSDLDEILAFIAEDSPEAASGVLDVVLGTADSLTHLADRGRAVPELHDPAIREVFVYSYRLMYQVREDDVRILALLHGARDFGAWHKDRTSE